MRKLSWAAISLILTMSLLASGCLSPAAATSEPKAVGTDLVYGPYVSAVSDTGASVHWISPSGAKGECRFLGESAGATMNVVTATIPGRTEVRHTARVTGLKPDARHRYVVTAGGDQAEGSFRTPPPVGSRKPFSFVITGDTQSFPLRIETGFDAVHKEAPAFVVHTGDLCDNGKDWSLWGIQFFVPGRDVLRQAPIWPARGNHERGVEPLASLFDLQAERLWHSFDYDNLHVVILDQWDLGNDKPMESERMEAMAAWLDQDLAAAKGRVDWILVAGHQQMFNVAGHGSTWGHEMILPLLYKHGVDLVVSGHSHLYERFIPIGPSGAKPIQFLVAGGGGAHNYPSMPSPILVKSFAAPHYCLYRVSGNRLDVTVKGPDGSLVDHIAMTKTGGQVPPAVAAEAIPPEDAKRLLKLYKGLSIGVPELPPSAGRPLACFISPRRFPAGSKVRIASDPGCPWTIVETKFWAPEPLAEGAEDTVPPVLLEVIPPAGVLLDEGQLFSPRLTATVELEYHGRRYVTPGVPLSIDAGGLARLSQATEAVAVPAAATAIAVDGDLAEWKDVPPLWLPSIQGPSRSLKLAWREDGLFGAVVAEQAEIHTSGKLPWNADSLEVNVEGDAFGRTWVGSLGVPMRIFFWPSMAEEDGSPTGGKAGIRRVFGKWTRGAWTGAWRKTPTGYAMEFRISAKALTAIARGRPAEEDTPEKPLEAGRVIGLDLLLRRDGQVVEQFIDARPFRATASSPPYWGRIKLSAP